MSVQHRAFRLEVAASAQLVSDEGTTVPCIIRNISLAGARIEFHPKAALPSLFCLRSEDLALNDEAWISWRSGTTAGIRFLDPIVIGSF